MQVQCKGKQTNKKKSSAADNKKKILFVPRCEIWRDVVFKLTDCPRNVGDSATPSDKEDLISTFVQKKNKNKKQCYINFTSHSVQDNRKRKENKKRKQKHHMFVRFSFTVLIALPSYRM